MQHLRVATYRINKGSFQEIADTARTGMLKTFQAKPGFIPTPRRRCLWPPHGFGRT